MQRDGVPFHVPNSIPDPSMFPGSARGVYAVSECCWGDMLRRGHGPHPRRRGPRHGAGAVDAGAGARRDTPAQTGPLATTTTRALAYTGAIPTSSGTSACAAFATAFPAPSVSAAGHAMLPFVLKT